jgi:hypothetical protein
VELAEGDRECRDVVDAVVADIVEQRQHPCDG